MTVTAQRFAFGGSIASLGRDQRRRLVERASGATDATVRERVAAIVRRVRDDGDDALFALARELDRVELAALEVPRREWTRALDALDPVLRRAMERAARNVRTAHAAFVPRAQEV